MVNKSLRGLCFPCKQIIFILLEHNRGPFLCRLYSLYVKYIIYLQRLLAAACCKSLPVILLINFLAEAVVVRWMNTRFYSLLTTTVITFNSV